MVVSIAQSKNARFPADLDFAYFAEGLKLFETVWNVHVPQGKAQARSVQVTSEPSAVVPVEQKQEAVGKPDMDTGGHSTCRVPQGVSWGIAGCYDYLIKVEGV